MALRVGDTKEATATRKAINVLYLAMRMAARKTIAENFPTVIFEFWIEFWIELNGLAGCKVHFWYNHGKPRESSFHPEHDQQKGGTEALYRTQSNSTRGRSICNSLRRRCNPARINRQDEKPNIKGEVNDAKNINQGAKRWGSTKKCFS